MAGTSRTRTRSIGISRVLQFFREGNEDEVRAVMPLVIEAVGRRHITINTMASAPTPRRGRPRRLNGAVPVHDMGGETNTMEATA